MVLEKPPQTSKKLLSQSLAIARRGIYQKHLIQQNKDAVLKEQILAVLTQHPSYGDRRIVLALGSGKKRVERCMKVYCAQPELGWRFYLLSHFHGVIH